ncbi:MAG: PD-(D/E)XK nuclease family protein [Candidatus Falkowbacteria bacterium]
MSTFYKPHRHPNWNYNPDVKNNWKLSRSKLDLFMQCPRCFYINNRLGTARPGGFPFNLNTAVDTLLKKEFDIHRAKNKQHPLQKKYGIDAVPVAHEDLDKWRHNFTGVQFLHKKTGMVISGAIDDLWVKGVNSRLRGNDKKGGNDKKLEYIVVDYKATSKDEEIIALDKDWQIGYKRQMEVYQWLLRQNKLKVSDTGYFVYCNGITDKKAFDAKLEFDITLIAYKGDDKWVEPAIIKAHKCLNSKKIPKADKDCDYCNYIEVVNEYN